MAPGVYSAISDYLTRMHRELIWPTIGANPSGKKAGSGRSQPSALSLPTPRFNPDKLARFRFSLMSMHANAYSTFYRVIPRPCNSNDDCQQGEECRDGVCVPVGSNSFSDSSGRPCRNNDDCQQGEECIDGVCTPVPHNLVFGAVSDVPDYSKSHELKVALANYYDEIARILIAGLAKHPERIVAVRRVLMHGYAACCEVAGTSWGACRANGDCEEGFECIDGICVPIPFRLVFPQSTDLVL